VEKEGTAKTEEGGGKLRMVLNQVVFSWRTRVRDSPRKKEGREEGTHGKKKRRIKAQQTKDRGVFLSFFINQTFSIGGKWGEQKKRIRRVVKKGRTLRKHAEI